MRHPSLGSGILVATRPSSRAHAASVRHARAPVHATRIVHCGMLVFTLYTSVARARIEEHKSATPTTARV